MNGDNNGNNASGTVNRNTYYNIDVPEWRCENCGKFNNKEARFCRSCGAPGPASANDVFVAEMPQKKSSAGKWVAIILAIVLVVAAATVAVIKIILPKNDANNTSSVSNQTESTDTASDSSGTTTNSEENTSDNQSVSDSSYYVVGNTYYVQTKDGIKVREGPGKNYTQLYRYELTSDEYATSLEGEYACLKQGSSVVCQGMSDDGNWMKISSGWICVWDANETLVR